MLTLIESIDNPIAVRIRDTVAKDRTLGHFRQMRCQNWRLNRGFALNLNNMILLGRRLDQTRETSKGSPLAARVYAYEETMGIDLGYVILSEAPICLYSGSKRIWEIWMVGIFHEHRGKGHGRRMFRELTAMMAPAPIVVARCYPASKAAQHILIRYGFTEIPSTGDEVTLFAKGEPIYLDALRNPAIS